MTQETGGTLAETTEQVNRLLHELETMVNFEQHETLTEFFSEWAVLSAMRTTYEMSSAASKESAPTTANEEGA